MSEEPDPERLKALEARLAKVKGVAKAPDRSERGKAFSQGEMAWRMVIELVSGMLLGLSIGYGLDYVFNTLPIFLVIFVLLGFIAGVRTMLGTAKQMAAGLEAKQRAADAGSRNDGDGHG